MDTRDGQQADKVILTGGCHDCGGRCVHKVHVRNGKIVRIETDGGDEPQYRSCVRGRAYRQRIYSEDRIQHPMKRVGARGEGKFEPISWDEALDTVAGQLKRVKDAYGPGAIFLMWCSGSHGCLHSHLATMRLLNLFGGFRTRWGNLSMGGADYVSMVTLGTTATASTRDDLARSRLIILWGWNPAVTIQGTRTAYYLVKAKEAGARFICVDPRFTDTVAVFADQWIPIRPGTDAALMAAMAHVMIRGGLQDQRFLAKYTVGFDKFREYVLGHEDGIEKTPVWAEDITGVPAAVIEEFAREYARTKPAALMNGWAPGRTAYGEQFNRMAITLAAMTGNIGVPGGNAAGCGMSVVAGRGLAGFRLPPGINPVERGIPAYPGASFDPDDMDRYRVQNSRIWDALLRGKRGCYPQDIKLLYIVGSNLVNQLPNVNKAVRALQKPQFIVHQEQFMTPTARFADILLPVNTHFERNDIYRGIFVGRYYIYANRAIEPLWESKSDFEIAEALASRLGVEGFSDKTEDEWLEWIYRSADDMPADIPDFKAFKQAGIHKVGFPGPVVAFEKQRKDPASNPFPTPSGKIEIYSKRLADVAHEDIPPIPKYIETWESRNDPLARKYPLQLITTHFRRRAHSVFDNIAWLRETQPQAVTMNSADAEARGIRNGDMIRIFNGRGTVVIPAVVTERIMPGVVEMGEGAWYAPDAEGVDHGGCPNVLTKDEYSPCGALVSNTCLVQVEKAG